MLMVNKKSCLKNISTYIVITVDDLGTCSMGSSLSTKASFANPNLEMGSLLSKAGKSVSTSPSSSAM